MQPIPQAKETLTLLAAQPDLSTTRFRIISLKTDKGIEQVLRVNGLVHRIFYAIGEAFSSEYREKRSVEILKSIAKTVSCISGLAKNEYIEQGRVTDLFNKAQRFNQMLAASQGAKKSIIEKASVRPITAQDDKIKRQLAPVSVKATETQATGEDTADQPEIKRGEVHRRYSNDIANHAAEAARIFLCTQAERIASLFCKRFRYFRGGLKEENIRTSSEPLAPEQETPSSYWVGHSTCFMSIPVRATQEKGHIKTINVITDPVEGSLNAILYPRQTKPGRMMEELPAIHVMLLSHNHLDHYSASTIKKLLAIQPAMVVPEGDGTLFTALGFTNVHEQKWWDKVDLSFSSGEEQYNLAITAVPSHHWAGQAFTGASSYFVGHVIQGAASGGDIYYAGDTARLEAKHLEKLRQKFDIRWMYQPGGPDEMRSDMESTHQSSADSLWMHTELFLKKALQKKPQTKEKFIDACNQYKTLLMHTSTFKLGNLHADDTKQSIARILDALERAEIENHEEILVSLRPYEQRVFAELAHFLMLPGIPKGFTSKDLVKILREGVFVPKIGSRIDFGTQKKAQEDEVQF